MIGNRFSLFALLFFACVGGGVGCVTVGHQVVLGPSFAELGKRHTKIETAQKQKCGYIILPVVFGLFGGLDGTGPLVAGSASVGGSMADVVSEWRTNPTSPYYRKRGWKLAYVTLDKKMENYLLAGRICTVLKATFVRSVQPPARISPSRPTPTRAP